MEEIWDGGGRRRQRKIMVFWPDLESKNSSQVCLMSSYCQMSLSTRAILQTTADIHTNAYTHKRERQNEQELTEGCTGLLTHT